MTYDEFKEAQQPEIREWLADIEKFAAENNEPLEVTLATMLVDQHYERIELAESVGNLQATISRLVQDARVA